MSSFVSARVPSKSNMIKFTLTFIAIAPASNRDFHAFDRAGDPIGSGGRFCDPHGIASKKLCIVPTL
jgi:hypothetical protein